MCAWIVTRKHSLRVSPLPFDQIGNGLRYKAATLATEWPGGLRPARRGAQELRYVGGAGGPDAYSTLCKQTRPKEDYARVQDQKQSDLIAAGMRPGTKAYDDQMQPLQRGLNGANTQTAVNSGVLTSQAYQMDQDRRKQAITEQLAQRQVPLNAITALMSSSQVSNPFWTPGYAQNAQVGAAPVFAVQQLFQSV